MKEVSPVSGLTISEFYECPLSNGWISEKQVESSQKKPETSASSI